MSVLLPLLSCGVRAQTFPYELSAHYVMNLLKELLRRIGTGLETDDVMRAKSVTGVRFLDCV